MKHKLINSNIRKDYISTLLKERGIEDIERFLHPTISDVEDPFLLDNMEKGLELFVSIMEKDEGKICLIVDCDCDGYCSSAIMYQFVKEINPKIEIEYLIHEGKAHGFEEHIDYLLDKEYDLIICPDAGSNDKKYTDQLKCPILILDHHILETEIGDNVVVINNQASPNYTNKDLCGGGVVWQFVRAYDKKYGTYYSIHYTDLAALSIIGDMMGLNVTENQAIIKLGMTEIYNKFFRELLIKQKYSITGNQFAPFEEILEKATPEKLAWYIVPLINGMVRAGAYQEKERMFIAFIDGDRLIPCHKRGAKGTMEKAAVESARECGNAKNHQDKEKIKIIEQLEVKIFNHNLLDNKILFVRLDDDDVFPSELNGLVAMGLASKYKRPAIVARLNKEGYVRGSARGLNESELDSFKEFLNSTNLFEYTAGHDNAFGISIPSSNLTKLHEFANDKLKDLDFSVDSYDVNFERHAFDADLCDLIVDIAKYNHIYGQKNPTPLIYVDSINLKQGEWRVMGTNKDTVAWEKNGVKYIQWRASALIEELNKYPEVQLEIVGEADMNEWPKGNFTPQIRVKNYEVKNGTLAF